MVVELGTLQYILALVSLITGLAALSKPVRRGLKRAWDRTFGKRGRQLDRIVAELQPNGGDSIRDSLDRIELKQIKSEAFLNAQLNVHRLAVFRTDESGKVIAVNRLYQRLLGVSHNEVRGDGWINVLHPDDRDLIVIKWASAVESQIEFSEEVHFIHTSGEDFWGHVNAYRELDARGIVLGWLGVIIPRDLGETCPHLRECKAKMGYG